MLMFNDVELEVAHGELAGDPDLGRFRLGGRGCKGDKGGERRGNFHAIIQGTTYCCRTTRRPSSTVRAMLCLKVRAKTTPSCPFRSVTGTPVAIYCGEIILPITPRMSLWPQSAPGSSRAGWRRRPGDYRTGALPEVSLPDRKTAIQPRNG